eukprot:6178196-Pleurochrysis_carterae.AAC.1
MQRDLEKERYRQKHPERTQRQEHYRSYAARAQICALGAGDKECTVEYDPRYSCMLSKMREALQLLEHGTAHDSTEGIQGEMSITEARPPVTGSSDTFYRTSQAPTGPLEINLACSVPTPLKVVEKEGLFDSGADTINAFLSVEPPRQRLCAQSFSGCMKARIKLRLDSTRSKDLLSVRAVVDSGAAHTAKTRSVFRRLGGTRLQPTRLTFTEVGGESLKCLGRSP